MIVLIYDYFSDRYRLPEHRHRSHGIKAFSQARRTRVSAQQAAQKLILQAGKSIEEAAEIAILSGTLQFHKQGIQPITKDEISRVITGS